ncbi:MAG: AI-2E family transporter [Agathobacter sp.]|nr:AI-2E family transporter [Agathobacter sp.]
MSEQKKSTIVEEIQPHSWKHYLRIGFTVFLTVAACISFFFMLYRWSDISKVIDTIFVSAQPITIGLVLTYLLMPVKNFVEKPVLDWLLSRKVEKKKAKGWARAIGITGALIFLFVIIAILIAMMVPALVTSIVGLAESLPGYVESFVAWIEETGVGNSTFAAWVGETIINISDELQNWAKTELLPLAQQYIAQITSGVFSVIKAILNFLIGIIVVVYVMSIQETLLGQCKKVIYALFPARKANIVIKTIRKSNEIFGGFVIGKIIDSAIIGMIAYFGCTILQIPSTFLVAFIIGVTNIIPFFGPFIGAVPSVLLVLIQSPIHGLYLVIFILVLQQVDGNIIGPKILGDKTGLASFWVLFSILIAGGLFGFFGMVLGVPVFAVLYYIWQQYIIYRMKKKNLSPKTEDYVKLIYIDEETNELMYTKAPKAVQKVEEKK